MKSDERRKGVKFNNVWQTLFLIVTIMLVGFTMNDKLDDALFTEEEVTKFATEAAENVVYAYRQDDALVDTTDFVQGWIESEGITMEEYVCTTYDYKTRVYKGGLNMIENKYETRDIMYERYGEKVINELVEQLIKSKF